MSDGGPVLLVMAMEAEARPVRVALGLHAGGQALHDGFDHRFWSGTFAGREVALVTNGRDRRFDVDAIGTLPAAMGLVHALGRADARPSLVLSAGTAGGFAARDGAIGKVYVADRVVFHDRRIPIPGWDAYGVSDIDLADLDGAAEACGFARGTVSTGDALDAPDVDLAAMAASGCVAKEMEAAAVGWVAQSYGIGFAALKVITDIVDSPHDTAEEFDRNLALATEVLADAVPRLLRALGSESR